MPTPFQIVDGTTGNPATVSGGALLVSGTVTSGGGNVTVVNGNSTAAVNIQDGGNSITVDGSLTTVSTVSALTAGNITVVNTAAAAANVITSFLFSNITTATTTTVKSGAGTLRGVTVNTKGGVASAVVIYDNTAGSGTKIGTIDSLNLSGQFQYDVAFATGCTLVTTGTGAPDITVSYR